MNRPGFWLRLESWWTGKPIAAFQMYDGYVFYRLMNPTPFGVWWCYMFEALRRGCISLQSNGKVACPEFDGAVVRWCWMDGSNKTGFERPSK